MNLSRCDKQPCEWIRFHRPSAWCAVIGANISRDESKPMKTHHTSGCPWLVIASGNPESRTKDSGTVEFRISLDLIKILNTMNRIVGANLNCNEFKKKKVNIWQVLNKKHTYRILILLPRLLVSKECTTLICFHVKHWGLSLLGWVFVRTGDMLNVLLCKNGFWAPDFATADRSPVKINWRVVRASNLAAILSSFSNVLKQWRKSVLLIKISVKILASSLE